MRGFKTTATCIQDSHLGHSRQPSWEPDASSRSLQEIRLYRLSLSYFFSEFFALQGKMADDQPLQDIIDASSRSEIESIKDAIQSSLANFTIQVTQVFDNKLGEIKEQLVSNKSLQSGSYLCNQNSQQPLGERAKVDSNKSVVDDYNI